MTPMREAHRTEMYANRGRVEGMLGLRALVDEMADEGVAPRILFADTGIDPDALAEPSLALLPDQKLRIFENARSAAKYSDFALRAGGRQRVSDFGIYGYAMASSATIGDAIELCFRHLPLAGPMLDISFTTSGQDGILRSHAPERLGDLLPVAAEFWRASMHTLFSRILERRFPSTQMLLPYPPPSHWREYERLFLCPVLFGQDVMEWHFDIAVMDQPCPAANSTTAQTCRNLCEQMILVPAGETSLAREIHSRCLAAPPPFPTAAKMAQDLGISLRGLHRRLAAEGKSYKTVVDSVREYLAKEFLAKTTITVEEVAERVGYSDAANFRKAFKRWTGQTPGQYSQISSPRSQESGI